MQSDETVIARRDGRIGRILLNRPKALNALDLPMLRACASALDAWRDDPHVHAVVIESASDRAFCAGGDIRAIRQDQLNGSRDAVEDFFRTEYALNLAIATYPKPYIALIDGICMGGGIGVSVHGTYRVVTEHVVLSMPETAIGFFPDIGATFFLPRLPGELGLYLALTGARLRGGDAVHGGLATHFTRRDKLAGLSQALANDGPSVLARFAEPLPPFSLGPHRGTLDHCFAAESVAGIIRRLDSVGDAWALETAATLRAMSPTALCCTLEAMQRGAGLSLPHCLEAELRLTRSMMQHPDFAEGVRAMVIDKDRKPSWQPGSVDQVNPEAIATLFE
jgi:enoyl-CoA hydratase